MTTPLFEQDRTERRGAIHAELMEISRGLNRIHPSREPVKARELLSRRRELQAEYAGLAPAAK